jgi:hypothetical protein
MAAGELILEGVGQSQICIKDSSGHNSLQDALQASFAEAAGVSFQMVEVKPEVSLPESCLLFCDMCWHSHKLIRWLWTV